MSKLGFTGLASALIDRLGQSGRPECPEGNTAAERRLDINPKKCLVAYF
jgi:hypothetical protein